MSLCHKMEKKVMDKMEGKVCEEKVIMDEVENKVKTRWRGKAINEVE